MKQLKFADLFCGCGGLSIGLANAGLKDTVSADFWDVAKANYTSYHLLSESTFYSTNMFDKKQKDELIDVLIKQKIDVLAGGPPCQGFSTLGKREEKDKRNTLVEAYLEVANRVKPKIIIMENVPAIQSMKHSSGIKYPEYAKKFLSENGYYAETIFIEGSQVGLSQRRKRLFLIALNKDYFSGIDDFSSVLLSVVKELQPATECKSVRDAIGDLPILESGEGKDVMIVNGKTIFNHSSFKHSKDIIKRIEAVPENGGLQDIPDSLLSKHLKKMKHGGYGSGGFVKNLYGRLNWNEPSGTIVAGIKKVTCGRFFHPSSNRLLTVREAARLQSFPDDYQFVGGIIDQYTVVGNAVPPKFGEFIGNIIIYLYRKYGRSNI